MSDALPFQARRPVSDVSAGVGLCGLAALVLWLLACRNWAALAEAFSLPGPREPLSGPYASVATLLVTGTAMTLWSVLVDKVHLRESTGIDWKRRGPSGETLDVSITKLAGLWATWAAIGFYYCIARWYWDGQ
ncbi:MAG TPA: protein-S-isoprenylcysteine methyltransferase, partial [Novosphingobium sp.]|nr:protein-S-isoprenylcysteine methyltransferase [Novosphingobium sp.]